MRVRSHHSPHTLAILAVAGVAFFVAWRHWQASRYQPHTRTLHAIFRSVGGLAPGDPLRVDGLAVGKVERCDLARGGVLVTLAIRPDVALHRSDAFSIQAAGLLGPLSRACVSVATSLTPTGIALTEWDLQRGAPPVTPEVVLGEVRTALLKVDGLAVTVTRMASENRAVITSTLAALQGALEVSRQTLAENRAAMRMLLAEGAAIAQEVTRGRLVESTSRIASSVATVADRMRQLAEDPRLTTMVGQTAAKVETLRAAVSRLHFGALSRSFVGPGLRLSSDVLGTLDYDRRWYAEAGLEDGDVTVLVGSRASDGLVLSSGVVRGERALAGRWERGPWSLEAVGAHSLAEPYWRATLGRAIGESSAVLLRGEDWGRGAGVMVGWEKRW